MLTRSSQDLFEVIIILGGAAAPALVTALWRRSSIASKYDGTLSSQTHFVARSNKCSHVSAGGRFIMQPQIAGRSVHSFDRRSNQSPDPRFAAATATHRRAPHWRRFPRANDTLRTVEPSPPASSPAFAAGSLPAARRG